ncbi:DUF1292 domain-containing protein [Clostridium sp. YIM B02515]|uniref:DUF1292 domain-containing protein n=1 Tax=Clostridium rhizosphaerae TaxID=2803861 RepID=A0ABS1TB68_9CLOT|nr:DUF1292 domain-containing protein [Clostridium rhizosphaerae]MBL4935243.1 DUF1292 domain-containing protein [Clostridium rhizosphaerae]
MEEKVVMSFKNENGEKVDFEAVAEIYLDEKKYLILAPVEGDEEDAYVFRVDNENDQEVLNLVEDDNEFLMVNKEYKKLLYNEQ